MAALDTRKWFETFRALLPPDLWTDPIFREAKEGGSESLLAYVEDKTQQAADDAVAFEQTYPKLDRLNRRVGRLYRAGDLDALEWATREMGLSLSRDELNELAWFREQLAERRSREASLRELARAIRTDTPRRWTWSGDLVPDRVRSRSLDENDT
jgi:hypothetical protein